MAKQKSLARALIGIGVAGALTASVLAATINVEVGGTTTTYTCTTATVDVVSATGSFGGCTAATTSGTTTSTSGTTTSTSGTTTSTSGTTTSTSGTTTSTSGTTTSTSGTTTTDPGWGTGTWIPADQPNTRVVDQQGTTSINYTYAPGCVNNYNLPDAPSVCPTKYQYVKTVNGVTTAVTLAQPTVLSIRYRYNGAVLPAVGEYFQINSGVGGGLNYLIQASLTENPGDFAPVNSGCKVPGNNKNLKPRIYIGSAVNQCPVVTGRLYYLNIKVIDATPCTGGSCVFKISPEPLSMVN